LGVGCPPPHYVDIFNNTGATVEIGPKFELAPHESRQFRTWALFERWEDTDSTGRSAPVLRLKIEDRCVDYLFETEEENWVHENGGLTAGILVQIDRDLPVRLAREDGQRPIPRESAQPEGWPLRPRAIAPWPTVEQSQAAHITFFRLEGGGRKSVFIDDTEVARLPSKRRFTVSVTPGQRSINAETQGNDPILVDLESGRHYYVQLYKSFWAVGEDVKVVGKEVAEAALLECLPNPCELNFDKRIHAEQSAHWNGAKLESRHNNRLQRSIGADVVRCAPLAAASARNACTVGELGVPADVALAFG
jgi:hypothetical protein